jgi:RimJ/RimL family protein N-acetyltransferase
VSQPTDPPAVPGEPVLRGRLTWLRAPERSDIPHFVRWFNDAGTLRYLAGRGPMSEEQESRWFDRMIESQGRDRWLFTICRLGEHEPIGNLGLFEIDLRHGGAGVGITIGEAVDRGQGLGTDALEALLDFGFAQLRLERLWLDVYPWNARAIRSYEKAGLTIEGTMKRSVYRDGRYHDLHRMAILRAEWAARRKAEPLRPPVPDV